MFDLRKIQDEISRGEREYETLRRNIELMEREARYAGKRVEAATGDITRAKRKLQEQENDLARVTKENDTTAKKIKESQLRMADYKQNIDKLQRQFKQMQQDNDRNVRR
jgi:chromosome segregation ATPase